MGEFKLRDLDPQTVKSSLDRGECILVDVREANEYAREHIAGAKLMPLATLDRAALGLRDPHTNIVVHCASGLRSPHAAKTLAAAGIVNVANLAGGLQAWKQAGLATVEDRSAPLPIMRQVQLVAGSLIMLGVALGTLINPWFYALSAFVGAGLFLAGATGWCGMAMLLARLPYNRRTA
ncbi:MAG: rhodanese-like domain-containing protein [Proteobacteria bacterium]|nr:rhodanese-like domain-containing protein [Pseudomonadota bacterium]